ncbi:MAG: adenylyltransferase/cytidyltransferase family protein [Verrucomicrobia bacterium]|nr:adenylyltransferase/cytidyltransferase family protein [Verrucomicrobiota bacterium]
MNFRDKLIPWEDLPRWRAAVRARRATLVATNGCFDLLHVGHVTYLEAARNLGDALLVGLTRDLHVQALKGPGRPVNPEQDRAAVLAALACVDGVCIFPDLNALGFLAAAEPDIYAKGGDYTLDTLNQEERRFIESRGGRIVILPGVPSASTSAILARMGAKP